jgi:hypothetical protein
MGIFDVFTGAPAKDAAKKNIALMGQSQGYLSGVNQQNRDDLDWGLGRSLEALGQGFNRGRDALTTGYRDSTGAINTGFGDARTALDAGYGGAFSNLNAGADAARAGFDRARGDLSGAVGAFDDLAGLGRKYGAATSLYQDSLGVNGAEGIDRARGSFVPSLSYDFNLNQGLDAINRARNARGMANSGNTDRDAQEYGAGLASRELGGWQDRLAGFINPELAAVSGAATGRAGAMTNLANVGLREADFEAAHGARGADLARGQGTAIAGLDTGRAGMLADLAQRYGTGMYGAHTGEGAASAGAITGNASGKVGSNLSIAPLYAKTYENMAGFNKDAANAQMQGAGNLWGLGLNLAKLGVGAYGSGMFDGWGGMFGGGGASAANPGVAGGGYLGPGGQIYEGPGYYGKP